MTHRRQHRNRPQPIKTEEQYRTEQTSRRQAAVTTAAELDEMCKQGCSDPQCTTPPEEHEEMYLTSHCHPESKAVWAFYDRITKEVCHLCAVCGKGIAKMRIL